VYGAQKNENRCAENRAKKKNRQNPKILFEKKIFLLLLVVCTETFQLVTLSPGFFLQQQGLRVYVGIRFLRFLLCSVIFFCLLICCYIKKRISFQIPYFFGVALLLDVYPIFFSAGSFIVKLDL
jgi:hypothetical protein